MAPKTKDPDLTVRKRPSQERSRETFEAIVQACAQVLAERGYAGTTTNHIAERAGVSIASLYEYFSGKDAVIAVAAERLVDRVLGRLRDAARRLADVDEDDAVRRWMEAVYETVAEERSLVVVFDRQVPYTSRIEPLRELRDRLVQFSERFRAEAGAFVHPDFNTATLHLVVNLVTSTILQLVIEPLEDVAPQAVLDELAERTEAWIRHPKP